jgi:hypothetical protein
MNHTIAMRNNLVAVMASAAVVVLAGCSSSSANTTTSGATTSPSASAPTASGPISQVAAIPSGVKTLTNFGDQTAVALPKAGAPVVAYTWLDTNNDGAATGGDDRLLAAAYDPTGKKWGEPVKIADGSMQRHSGLTSIAAGADSSTGTVAVAFEDQAADGSSKGIKLAFSTDQGKTWATTLVSNLPNASGPAIAMTGGKTYVSYIVGDVDDIVVSQTATLSGPAKWTNTSAPKPVGGAFARFLPAMALDSAGTPNVAFYATADPTGLVVESWKVGTTSAVHVFDSKGVQNDTASVGIAFKGTTAVVVTSLEQAPNADESKIFWAVTSSDGGKTWSAGTKIAPDKGESNPFGVSIAAGKTQVLLTYKNNSGNGSAVCGQPKLAISADLAAWKVCSPYGGPTPVMSTNEHPGAGAGPDGTLYAVFSNSDDSSGGPSGVLLYNNSAAGAGS